MSKSSNNQQFRPGQTVPTSGQYGLFGPRGGTNGNEVTSVRGEPFPPSPRPGMTYRLNDRTK